MSEQESVQTEEDKFFGVRTKIGGQPEPEPVEEEEPLEEVAEADTDEGELTDDELSGYSKRFKKRINKLKYEAPEERRKTQSAMQERDEAFRVAQQIAEKNKEYESLIGRGEQALINQVKERAALAVEQAKQQSAWERSRFIAHILLQPHAKKGSRIKPEDIVQFTWEKEREKAESNVKHSEERIEHLAKYLEENSYLSF